MASCAHRGIYSQTLSARLISRDTLRYIVLDVVVIVRIVARMGLWFTVIVTGIDRWSKRFFVCYFLDETDC